MLLITILYSVPSRVWTPTSPLPCNFANFEMISARTGNWWGLRRDRIQLPVIVELIWKFAKLHDKGDAGVHTLDDGTEYRNCKLRQKVLPPLRGQGWIIFEKFLSKVTLYGWEWDFIMSNKAWMSYSTSSGCSCHWRFDILHVPQGGGSKLQEVTIASDVIESKCPSESKSSRIFQKKHSWRR